MGGGGAQEAGQQEAELRRALLNAGSYQAVDQYQSAAQGLGTPALGVINPWRIRGKWLCPLFLGAHHCLAIWTFTQVEALTLG